MKVFKKVLGILMLFFIFVLLVCGNNSSMKENNYENYLGLLLYEEMEYFGLVDVLEGL